MTEITLGVRAEVTIEATPETSATNYRSGGIDVFATPAMLALMERTAVAAIDHLLEEGQASVGTAVSIKHLAATPIGDSVRADAEVTAVDGRKVEFSVKAWDSTELIGEGEHTRFIIDVEHFMARVQKKSAE